MATSPPKVRLVRVRRIVVWLAAIALVTVAMVVFGVGWAGGAFTHQPEEMETELDPAARGVLERALRGIDPAQLVDHHVHVVGLGEGGTGAFVHPDLVQGWSVFERIRFEVYASASGIEDLERADSQYIDRLVRLIETSPTKGRFHLLAFEQTHDDDGTPRPDRTAFHVPNARVFALAEKYPEIFEPTLSLHPYRKDAVEKLEHWAGRGGRFVKWLPNAMGIDPSDPRCDPFYDAMRSLGLALLTHGGEEKAVAVEDGQSLGNPLLLRRPLDRGVTVVVAHCASLGENEDLDDPDHPLVPSFELFLRLMEEPAYEGLVFGEISALTLFNRVPEPLRTLLARRDLHARLVNGSDYPLPAVNAILWTRSLARHGFITDAEREALNAIYDFNPLLFDLIVKRTIRHPDTGNGFPASVFYGIRKPGPG